MTDKEKQIEEIKDTIDSVYGCDCAYYGVEGFAIAEALYEAGYRRQSDIINDFVNRLKEKPMIYRIPLLGLSTKTEIEDYVDDLLMQFRNAIDAVASQMKGGAE